MTIPPGLAKGKHTRRRGACFYCLRPFTDVYPNRRTIEHRIPKSRRELPKPPTGFVAALTCEACNHLKGNATEAEFLTVYPLGAPDAYLFALSVGRFGRNTRDAFREPIRAAVRASRAEAAT